jgi:hypothetical protein|tara:strand:- start:39 stop:872 length:834 start_codon:yes stop_codon:yes gene_type:complete
MDSIIGLGAAGCKIADKFSQYPQYDVYKMDVGLKRTPRTYGVKNSNTPEEFENSIGSLKRFFKPLQGKVLFVVAASGLVSGASLKILEQIKSRDISVLCICSDPDLMGEVDKMQQRLTTNVFQQYARSGVFRSVCLVYNNYLENILGDVPIIGFHEKLNDLLISTIHMATVLDHSDSVMDNISPPHEVSRVSTYGIVDFQTGEEKLFFPIDNIREKVYYYAINENKLRESSDIRKKIISQVKENSIDTKVSYGIYSTQYEEGYVYCVAYSSTIQQLD